MVGAIEGDPINQIPRVSGRANLNVDLVDRRDDTRGRQRGAESDGIGAWLVRLSWSTQRYGSGGGQS
jgi:hypothetical protein